MGILLQYNLALSFAVMELQEATSMDVNTLYKVLDTVIISNLLVVINNEDSPGANGELCRETVVSLGVDYSNEKARVNINVPVKIESNGEEDDAYYRIEQERRIAIQATIVACLHACLPACPPARPPARPPEDHESCRTLLHKPDDESIHSKLFFLYSVSAGSIFGKTEFQLEARHNF